MVRSGRDQRGFRRAGDLSADRLEMPPARVRELRLATAWRKVAGEAIAQRAPVRGLKRGVLEIEVPDERWAATLRELIPRLAGRLAAAHPDLGVKKLRLRGAGETERPRARAVPTVPSGDETDDVPSGAEGVAGVEAVTPRADSDGEQGRENVPLDRRLGRLAERYLERAARRDQKP